MRVVNGVVILSVLTISAWKCGQANAAPDFWNSDNNDQAFDTKKYFSDDERNQHFEVKTIFAKDKVELENPKIAESFNEGHAGHSTRQQEDHGLKTTEYNVPVYNQQRKSSPYDQQSITYDSSNIPQYLHNHKSVNQGGDDFVQSVDQLIVFNASKKLQQAHVNGQTNGCEDSSVTPDRQPVYDRQRTDQPSRPYGQSSYDRQNGQGVYNSYNTQQGSYPSTGRQSVDDRQRTNQPSGSYGQSSYDRQNGQGVYNSDNTQQGSYPSTGRQSVDDRQRTNQPSESYGQSSYDRQSGQGVHNSYNTQQRSFPSTGRQSADDRQLTNQPSGSKGQSSYDRQNGQDVSPNYNRQQGSYASTGRQSADDRQRTNQPSGSYEQFSSNRQSGQGEHNSYNTQQGSYPSTGRQSADDLQRTNQPSGSYGQSFYDRQNGQDVSPNYNRQQGSYTSTGRLPANDRNTEQVNPNNDRPENSSFNYFGNWDVYSSVPLKEVDSHDGHRTLAGTVKIPGGVSSVAIKQTSQSLDTSSVIKYGNLAPKGGVYISTNQEIGS